jgi:hypothetical protein
MEINKKIFLENIDNSPPQERTGAAGAGLP